MDAGGNDAGPVCARAAVTEMTSNPGFPTCTAVHWLAGFILQQIL